MQTPDIVLLQWLEASDQNIIKALVKGYLFMTTEKSEGFTFDDTEALAHIKHQITRSDFPQRRVARLITIRSLFSFILSRGQIYAFAVPGKTALSIETVRLLQVQYEWQQLCQEELSDTLLTNWLEVMDR